MGLNPGTRIGPYEITSAIGAGGMGEVYRARDTKLDRDVAIKVLPESFAADADRVARFTREAKTLASMNHPNIAAIYGIEGDGGPSGLTEPRPLESPNARALVMELVEGADLSQRIGRGAIPMEDALPIARQVADALEAAHEQGIVHRDLKPQNIKVRDDGTVKVLDFGLAKALVAGGTSGPLDSRTPGLHPADAATVTSPALTAMGLVLGTAAYMSPEQARGKAVDRRADIWAFGVVLYEMLTGRRCFPGEEISDVLAAVLRQDIDWTALPSTTPASVRRLLERCLERDPRQRLRDIGEARIALARIDARGGTADEVGDSRASSVAQRTAKMSALPWGIAALAVALAATALWLWPRPVPAPEPIQFTLEPPEGSSFDTAPGFISVSPDGQYIAYITGNQGIGATKLWLRSLRTMETRPVLAATNPFHVAWSPDGLSIAYIEVGGFGQNTLRRVDVAGGPSKKLIDNVDGRSAWSSQNVILFSSQQRLMRVPASGGPPSPATEIDTSAGETAHMWPVFLPDGRRFIFLAANKDTSKSALFLASLDSMERTRLVDVHSMVDVVPGYLIYHREGTLYAHPFDENSGTLTGDPQLIVEDVRTNVTNGRAAFATSRTGLLVYRASGAIFDDATLSWLDRAGKVVGTIGQPDRYGRGALSPDGRRFVVPIAGEDGRSRDLFMIDIERGIRSQFTSDGGNETAPLWTPDGESVVFVSDRKGTNDLYIKNAGGAAPEQVLYESTEPKQATGYSPDGKLLLFHAWARSLRQVWALPVGGDGKPFRVFPNETGDHSAATFSPDGKWIAYRGGATAQGFVQPFPPTGYKEPVSAFQGTAPTWTADGRHIAFLGPRSTMMLADVTPEGGRLRIGTPRPLFEQPGVGAFAMDKTGQRFLLLVPTGNPADLSRVPLTVIANWTSLVTKK